MHWFAVHSAGRQTRKGRFVDCNGLAAKSSNRSELTVAGTQREYPVSRLIRPMIVLALAFFLAGPISGDSLNISKSPLRAGVYGSSAASASVQVRSLATQLQWTATQARISVIVAAEEVLNMGIELTDEEIVTAAPVFSGDAVGVSITLASLDSLEVRWLEDAGVRVLGHRDQSIEALVPLSILDEIERHPGVGRVDLLIPPSLTAVDQAVVAHGASVWQSSGLTGTGVKIGIIDAGFGGFAALMGTVLPSTVTAGCHLAGAEL